MSMTNVGTQEDETLFERFIEKPPGMMRVPEHSRSGTFDTREGLRDKIGACEVTVGFDQNL